jgi:hypothetical protein
MRLANLARGAVLWALFAVGAAWARPPQEFKAPATMTEEQIAASKAKSKSNINGYGKDVSQETKPFPWKAAALFGLVFIVAAPFAIRAYLSTAKELSPSNKNAFGGRSARGESPEEEA